MAKGWLLDASFHRESPDEQDPDIRSAGDRIGVWQETGAGTMTKTRRGLGEDWAFGREKQCDQSYVLFVSRERGERESESCCYKCFYEESVNQ